MKKKQPKNPELKQNKRSWFAALKSDKIRYALFFAVIGAVISLGFSIYYSIVGLIKWSPWYSVFASYLRFLAILRLVIVLVYRLAHLRHKRDETAIMRAKLRLYTASGAALLPFTVILAFVIALLLAQQKPVSSDYVLALATAAYTFVKIITAIINFAKAKRLKDPLLQTLRNIGLILSVVSIVLLESTLITAFSEMNFKLYVLIAVSGLIGCAFNFILGLYMVIRGSVLMKRLKRNEPVDEIIEQINFL